MPPANNTDCAVCAAPFYASPGHLRNGWGKTCSIACRDKYKPNPRFIKNDEQCKHCGKLFHVKPSKQRAGKARIYCTDACRLAAVQATKTCPHCKAEFSVPYSHRNRRVYCSNECRTNSCLNVKNNCVCVTCGKDFYTKPSAIKRKAGNGTFCSVGCMTSGRSKVTLPDGKPASHLEVDMYMQIKATGLDAGMEREHLFHSTRKWRLDFAWPEKKIGLEVHGAIWGGKSGGHTSGKGRLRDMEKMNEAKINNWKVIEVASEHIKSGQAIDWLERLLRCQSGKVR